jgi:hypothetical protein
MKRCLAEGRDRFELWVGAAVLANSLMRIAALLTPRSPRRRKRCYELAALQLDRLTMRLQSSQGWFHSERGHVMLVAGLSWPAGARRHIEQPSRGVRPRILDAGVELDRSPFRQCGSVDIDFVMSEIRSNARIQRRFVSGRSTPRES